MEQNSRQKTGVIFDIQRFSIHDGPGIRTLIFMKGCPLRCRWCSNPEGLEKKQRFLFSSLKCRHEKTRCNGCLRVCKHNAISIDFHVIVSYGVSISTVADNLIENVKYKVEEFTGMPVEKINIFVEGVRVID